MAIIDSGLDWKHGSFRQPNVRFGSPRLAASVRAHGPCVLTLLEAPLAVHRA